MKLLRLILHFGVLILLSSCIIPITDRKNFKVFKNQVYQGTNKYRLRYDGIYVSVNSSGAIAFYADGKQQTLGSALPRGAEFWSDPDGGMEDIVKGYKYDPDEIWGDYNIKNDTFYSEGFGLNYTELIVRQFFIEKGVLLNDTTLVINSNRNTHYNIEFVKGEPNIFRFYKTKLKPDSTKIWYLNKRWYKKSVHESRRVKD